ncbi:MAG: putative pyrophosphatase or phosphodiesterase, AlkP superfamily [Bryobacterales bacterium]|nr:putative pyrophosphatase or phosphodiesterase, AlkP superfamily [Bryobacterales bacterium]
MQSTYLTGAWPSDHGIVGNGWYFRDECEIKFWKQANPLVQKPKVWDLAKAKDPKFTCANLFWWYAMYSGADYTITPRPMYPADGRKLPDIWTNPSSLRAEVQRHLGPFPLFNFWGPATSIKSTQWIADAAIKVDAYDPTLSLIYLPHLDYGLQKYGPDDPRIMTDLAELDGVCGKLIDYYGPRGTAIIFVSEYGITKVSQPVHLNRILRQQGLLAVREELGRELLDAGASKAFAVADHQVAHVYVNDAAQIGKVKSLLEAVDGVERVLDDVGKKEMHLDHARSGELVVIAKPEAWFTYYYWVDDSRAPDFARTVDIHRKPGYDPAELFLDPKLSAAKVRIAMKLLKKKLGFRYLMDVIPLDASLVKGSHGRPASQPADGPLLMTQHADLVDGNQLQATDVCGVILKHLSR